jgi:prolipoprotein diacylglyceryl transferase
VSHFIWDVDPILLHIGPLQLRWYGLLFVGSCFIGIWILQKIYIKEHKDPKVLDNFLIYVLIGAVVGASLMHCFAYEPEFYLSHPLEILKIYKGGLASHGGMIGVIVALYIFAKRYSQFFMWLLARVTIPGAVTAAFVRFGNMFNSEILGLPSDKPWAIIFARVDMIPRHPVQLYEAFSYLLLVAILIVVYLKSKSAFATKILPAIFLTYMFTVRFLLEFTKTRQADYQWDLPLTTGQALSLPFILIGIAWFTVALRSKNK